MLDDTVFSQYLFVLPNCGCRVQSSDQVFGFVSSSLSSWFGESQEASECDKQLTMFCARFILIDTTGGQTLLVRILWLLQELRCTLCTSAMLSSCRRKQGDVEQVKSMS